MSVPTTVYNQPTDRPSNRNVNIILYAMQTLILLIISSEKIYLRTVFKFSTGYLLKLNLICVGINFRNCFTFMLFISWKLCSQQIYPHVTNVWLCAIHILSESWQWQPINGCMCAAVCYGIWYSKLMWPQPIVWRCEKMVHFENGFYPGRISLYTLHEDRCAKYFCDCWFRPGFPTIHLWNIFRKSHFSIYNLFKCIQFCAFSDRHTNTQTNANTTTNFKCISFSTKKFLP